MSGIQPPLNLPDHSVLKCTFETSFFDISNQINSSVDARVQNSEFVKPLYRPPKKNLSKINSDFCMRKEIKYHVRQRGCSLTHTLLYKANCN